MQLTLTQQRLDAAHDPRPATDHDPITDLERLLAAQVTGRDHLLAAAQLIPVVDRGHRATIR